MKCLFCSKPIIVHAFKKKENIDNVCGKCEKESKAEQSKFLIDQRILWSKRKCNKCSTPLTPGHYYHCVECIRPINDEHTEGNWVYV